MPNIYSQPDVCHFMRSISRFIFAIALSLICLPSYAVDWGAAFGAAADSLAEGLKRQAESDRQLEQQKQLLQYQHELEMDRIRQQQAMERARREQQAEEERLQRIAAEARKKKQEEDDRKNSINTGTGFFISPNGYLITNDHVVRDKTTYAIRDFSGKFYRAQVVAHDSLKDLALLKVDGIFPSLKVGDSASVTKGQHVLAVGYPQISIQGNESKVTDGIISSFSGLRDHDHWFQISVPIQGGNSGGPLVTDNGVVIGVVVASVNVSKFYSTTGSLPQNVNFAIKSKVVSDFLADHRISNVVTAKGKTNIEAVDMASVLVIAKNSPIDVDYSVSPEAVARNERERQRQAAEESQRRKSEEVAEKKRQAQLAIEDAKRQKEERIAEQKRQNEERIAQRKQREEEDRIKRRDLSVQRAYPDWQETKSGDVFIAWLGEQSSDTTQKLDSLKPEDVIAVLKRYQAERLEFSEKYFQKMGAWIADEKGCKFRDMSPLPDETITWDGKCVEGRGDGKGVLTWLKFGQVTGTSVGVFKDGMLNSFGRQEIVGKGYTEGTFKNGRLEGKGKRVGTGTNVFEYEGSFKTGKYDGLGRLIMQNGNTVEGTFKDGKPEGKGKFVWKDGSIYEGEFHDGRNEGKGKTVFINGNSYEGDFKNNKPEGKGKFVWKEGSTYEGEFREGKGNGRGKHTFPNGNSIEGYFKDYAAEGQGKYVWKDGGYYEGNFRGGKFDGQGKQIFRDGGSYDGAFRDGKKEGRGTLVMPDGKRRNVEFSGDKLVSG